MSASSGDNRAAAVRVVPLTSEEESRCRFCNASLRHVFVDLGMQPLANAYLTAADLKRSEPFYPLRLLVCAECFLVQVEDTVDPERLFSDYAYFSSYSDSWLRHAQTYAEMAVERFGLHGRSRVVEVASNDGYLLRFFATKGVEVLGIDPASNVAAVANANGVPTIVEFFGCAVARRLAAEGKQADLLVGNNVLAHVPNLNDFVAGLAVLLKPQGVLTMEFPHLMRLIDENQFDTIYHEHFSYFSMTTAHRIFAAHGLTLFDVEELPTHGGSLRIFARHALDGSKPITPRTTALLDQEKREGVTRLEIYRSFSDKVKATKRRLLEFLIAAKDAGKTIAGYGAPAKGNTLLNYCGIRTDFIEWTVDRSPHKHGHFLPGTHIPIYHPDRIREAKPNYLLILPWNLKDEVIQQMSYIREWGGKFVTPIPEVRVVG
jgi:2-polyprenyl-3-methyl-5-hydroxy-6-metoxy-1,4-benzoquinol methylase